MSDEDVVRKDGGGIGFGNYRCRATEEYLLIRRRTGLNALAKEKSMISAMPRVPARLQPLLLERFYAKWEFAVQHNLSASDPEPVPMRELLALADQKTRMEWENLTLGYTQPDGSEQLRMEIAIQYRHVDPSHVTLTTGAQEALYLLTQSLVAPGDHVVVITPAYQILYEGAREAGGDVSLVPLSADTQWELDLDAVSEAFRPETKLLVINFPHNPTGSLPAVDQFVRLLHLCESSGIRVISDEVFRGIERSPIDRLPAATDVVPTAVSVGDLSKSYGLAGLRMGWVACRDPDVLEGIAIGRDYTTICGSAPSHVLGLIALRARSILQSRAQSIVERNVALANEFFESRSDVEWLTPRAGTTAFPRLKRGDVEAFCEKLATEEGVLLAPGSVFETGGGHFRLGLGHLGMEHGLAALDRVLSKGP